MRKLRFALLMVLAIGMMSSCRGRDGLDGRDGIDGLGVIKNVLIDVPQKAWNYSNEADNNYFIATVDMPEITKVAFREGLVKVYRCYSFDSMDAVQIELPYIRHNEELLDGQMVYYTETLDYEYSVGSLSIIYTVNDFYYEEAPPAMQFRCVVMY